jgi:ubiquinone/menaquinone biosynthesis C-methylase UbiE
MSTNKETIDWYNQHAQEYTNHVRNKDESIYHSLYEKPAMYAQLPELNDKTVLSLGCGSGEDSRYLKEQGATRSVGVDISPELIKIAQKTPGGCEFQVMDMEHLDFTDESFDFLYSSLAVHYIEDWTQLMSEAHRVLKSGGYFLFSCSHPVYLSLEKTEDDDAHYLRQLAKFKDKRRDMVTITGDYMHRKSFTAGDDFAVTTWAKSFGEIAAEITSAGFLISTIVEPEPDEKMRELAPNDYEALTKIPNFVIFKLLKP